MVPAMVIERLLLLFVAVAGAIGAAQGGRATLAAPAPSATPALTPLAAAQRPARAPLIRAARAADGLFYATVSVNGAAVRFLIDTGATHMVLTPRDAATIGALTLEPGAMRLATATGAETSARARFDRAVINGAALGPIDAVVASPALPVSLLGQDVLARLGTLRIAGDELIIARAD